MARKILSNQQESWLFEHYPNMSNEDLAKELTLIIRAQNIKDVEQLESALQKLPDINAKKAILKTIKEKKQFKDLSVSFIKKNAIRLGCPKKSFAHISSMNRKKIMTKFMKDWLDKAEDVSSPFQWFRTFKVRNIYFGKFDNPQQMVTFKSSLCNWNTIAKILRRKHAIYGPIKKNAKNDPRPDPTSFHFCPPCELLSPESNQ